MDAYSARTVQVHEKERELAQTWERKNGRAPNSRELYYITQKATLLSRKGKHAGQIDTEGNGAAALSWAGENKRGRSA